MSLTLAILAIPALSIVVFVMMRRNRDRSDLERHSITAEGLHSLLSAKQELLIFDVRQPLDLLAYPEMIPSAQRMPPDDLLATPSLIPKDKDTVVYCTCPSDKTSREVLRRALALRSFRVKFLKGGLEAWKMKGYPVEPYKESFHLYTVTSGR
ncbi:MAG TPA: rhodanese-like domain-containing protein [Terriglobales bacterium]|nr:rhodanese-like domain-containing protein [Terriglobales bacterium]